MLPNTWLADPAPGWLSTLLEWMTQHGSSVLLNWDEDDGLWECSFITGGERFTGISNRTAAVACRLAIEKAQAHARGEAR